MLNAWVRIAFLVLDFKSRYTSLRRAPLGVGLLCNLMISYGGRVMPSVPKFPVKSTFFLCSFCNAPVELETSKADEDGKAIHEECYVFKVNGTQAPTPATIRRSA